jgi:prepilin-type N-terminal cleavage/methylation domain-containing protein
MTNDRSGFSLTEVLVAVLLFGIICVPLYRAYFQQGIGQQRMIRDFIGVTSIAEKVLNRVEHRLQGTRKALTPLHKEVTPHILLGLEETDSWGFLGNSFQDDSGRLAMKFIPIFKSDAELRGFLLEESAITSDQRANNPALLKDVLKSINERAQMVTVKTRWLDQAQMTHDYRLTYITTLLPEFSK